MFTKKTIFILLIFLSMVTLIHAQSKGTIYFAMRMDTTIIDPVTGELPDMTWVHALEDSGYVVDTFYTAGLSTASEGFIDTLNNADLVIIGRSVPTTTLGGNDPADKEAWNNLTVPILTGNMWAMRNTRLNWFDTESIATLTDTSAITNADIMEPNDDVFNGLDLNTSDPVPWVDGSGDVLATQDAGYGILIASFTDDGNVAFVRFEPDLEFYSGTSDYPAGWRSFIGNGRDASSAPPFYYFNFTPESKKVWYAEVANMIKLGGGPKTGVKYWGGVTVPSTAVLSQNYPNPFNPVTTISYTIPKLSDVKVCVYDLLGNEVAILVNDTQAAGKYTVQFDGSNLSSGMYFYELQSEGKVISKKMALIK